MKLDEIVAWYQKKIGTYDKQQWEKTVEQKILDGFSSVTLRTAKLKTELIDVDLVRGSTFPKAKPKQSLLTVIRFAILRYLLLPVYSKWWVKQTSPNVFAILLFLYMTQMFNWAVYTFNIHRLEQSAAAAATSAVAGDAVSGNSSALFNSTTLLKEPKDSASSGIGGAVKPLEEHIVSLSELLIPMALSLLLSLIHSQIVATNTASGSKPKRRRFSNASQNGKQARGEPRVRRRKKLVKVRSQDLIDGSAITTQQQLQQQQRNKPINAIKKLHSNVEVNKSLNISTNVPYESISTIATEATSSTSKTCASPATICPTSTSNSNSLSAVNGDEETYHTTTTTTATSTILSISHACATAALPTKLSLDLKRDASPPSNNANNTDCFTEHTSSGGTSTAHRKRNVNWHSPIHNYAIETQEKQQQTSPETQTQTLPVSAHSSSSETNAPNKLNASIEVCVQEFYDDLINRTDTLALTATEAPSIDLNGAAYDEERDADEQEAETQEVFATRRTIGEDDGFESLNGKSSSGDEEHILSAPLATVTTTAAAAATGLKNQLRLRLNAGERLEDCRDVESKPPPPPPATSYRRKLPLSSESDYEKIMRPVSACDAFAPAATQTKKPRLRAIGDSSDETDEDGDVDAETITSPSLGNNTNYNECTTSATEWLGVTTNSEECSYSSEIDNSDDFKNHALSDEDGYDLDFTPTTILNPHGTIDRISCTIWDQREIKKAQMSVLEISSSIIERVESMPETNDYIYIGIGFSFLLSFIPCFCRLCEVTIDSDKPSEINYLDVPMLLWEKASFSFSTIFRFAFGYTQWERTILIIGFMQRLCLTLILFIIFAVAERTFKQRFLYGKLFSHLTSSRRARKSNLPHFRLNKVRNIKTWLSVRSYLKKRGPQRSVDIIVSAAFIVTLLLLAFLSVEWLKDSVHLHSHLNLEALMWSTTIGIFLLRFMTLGNKIHHKYRSVSVLITEQINLYLQIEQKPKKKEELMVSNSVLKLAADLLKELESPFKISGLSANPYLFTTIKVVILSALSGVLSEMLGFKLKLHKIKIK